MTRFWVRLSQSHGLEAAIKILRDPNIFELLLPSIASWDELIDQLDKRQCSDSVTLGAVLKWFSVIQALLCVSFLFPCLWPIVSKYCVVRLVRRGNNKFLYINRKPEFGGELPAFHSKDDIHIKPSAKSEIYITSCMVLHVRSIATDWLPQNIKSRAKRESKELRANRELFEKLCRKLRTYEEEYQEAVRQHLKHCNRNSSLKKGSVAFRFKRWIIAKVKKLIRKWTVNNTGPSQTPVSQRGYRKNRRWRRLRRTYSAIPAQEYEKEGLINHHLVAPTPQSKKFDVRESTSLFNLDSHVQW